MLHLGCACEVGAWLQALREDCDAEALAVIAHMCLASLHAHVDRASELTAHVASSEAAAES